jgi:hypothetical protein
MEKIKLKTPKSYQNRSLKVLYPRVTRDFCVAKGEEVNVDGEEGGEVQM